ncbi:hypothetical protein B0I32_106278 [Nonomuraea fuscirosea]|uniref:Uncharacterized protein n=1 Tax=Nonomuraea fuscirosea TaxID=1291556 RepID=A0A2T0N2D9_9ACTN|nr:hypothetical protein [Nonomuraea fuscirosea]PRX66142.1 hypothetical protein B0I32_106278 [Nonomuraea fuscirosea]
MTSVLEEVGFDQEVAQLLDAGEPEVRRCIIMDNGAQCRHEVVIVLLLGCVHEHAGETPLCQYHVEDVAHGEIRCPLCFLVEKPHSCRLEVLAEITTLGERRVFEG